MKRFLTCLFFCITPALSWADRPLVQELNDFSPGVDTQHLPTRIKGLQNARNFRTDQNFGLSRRLGFKNETAGCTFSTEAAIHLWQFTDVSNNDWLIRMDSNGWITAASGLGRSNTCLTTVVTGQFNVALETDANVSLGKFWLTNRTNGLWSWDGTTMVQYTNAPLAARVSGYKNRVVLTDISNEQSSIRFSGELNGADWSNDSRFSTSPISIRIGGVNDGYKVYDFFPGLSEGLIFKAGNLGGMYRLLGNDQRDFRVEQITPEIGTIYPNTIAQRGYTTIFLSNRGIDSYTPPYTFTPIGTPIQNLIDPLARQSALSNSRIVGSVTDWTAGASSPTANITTYTIVGSIAPNTHQFLDTDDSDFALGITSVQAKADLRPENGSLVFRSTPGIDAFNLSFETETSATWDSVTANSCGGGSPEFVGGRVAVTSAKSGSYVWGASCTDGSSTPGISTSVLTLSVLNYNTGALLASQSFEITTPLKTTIFPDNLTVPVAEYITYTLDTTAFAGTYAKIGIGVYTNSAIYGVAEATATTKFGVLLSTSVFVGATGGSWNRTGGTARAGSYAYADYVTPFSQGFNRDYTAWFQSQPFDTRVSSPNFDPFRATVDGGPVRWSTQSSSATGTCCWMANQTISTGSTITSQVIVSSSNRYIRYVATFSAINSQTEAVTQISVSSVTLGSYVTGYFRTAAIDLGAGINSWGLFTSLNDLGGDGSISYETQSNASPVFVESAWVPTLLNSVLTMPLNRYVFARITFQTQAATVTPFVDNITVNWSTGTGSPNPFSATYRESYYLFFSSNISDLTTNNEIAVYNKDNALNTFYGSTLAAAVVYNNTLMMGDAAGNGAIYSMDNSVDGTDAGRNVLSSFTSPRLDGGEPDADKIFDKIYMTISRADVSASQIFQMEYSVDASTTWYRAENIEISTGVAIQSKRSSFNSESLVQGHYIDIKVTELTTGNIPYTIERLKLYGTIKEIQ